MSKRVGVIVFVVLIAAAVIMASGATTDAADPLTALVERIAELESKVKVLELRVNALNRRVSLGSENTLQPSTDSASPRRKEIPTASKVWVKGTPPKKQPSEKKASSYVPRKEPEGYRGSPIGISGLYAAGRDILANKDKDTAVIRAERVAAVVGKKTLINGELLEVMDQGGKYRIIVKVQDKDLVEYGLPHARSPFDTIRINLSVGLDSPVAKFKKGRTVQVQGVIKSFQVRGRLGKGVGINIDMTLEDGQVK